jgi:hypothetical protein
MTQEISLKDQILWYIERLIDHLTEHQAQTILAMLNRFYIGRRE